MYNQLFTMHGTTMVFLAIMPLSAAFFNFLIPLQIGARDVAFPRLNAFSYWVYLFGGIFITLPIFVGHRAERRLVRLRAAHHDGVLARASTSTSGCSACRSSASRSLAAAFNFITTIINMRAPGMNLMRMPMFTWMTFVVQFLLVLAFPVITVALVFLQFDRFFGTNFYTIAAGADPLLWQHLFWIFGHPEVYILILPAFGLVSRSAADVLAQAAVRLPRDGLLGHPDRLPRLRRVGAPHVRGRHGPDRRLGVLRSPRC